MYLVTCNVLEPSQRKYRDFYHQGKIRKTEAIWCVLVSSCFNMGIGDLELLKKLGMKVRLIGCYDSSESYGSQKCTRNPLRISHWPAVAFREWTFQSLLRPNLRASHWRAQTWNHRERVPWDMYSWLLQAAWNGALVVLTWPQAVYYTEGRISYI